MANARATYSDDYFTIEFTATVTTTWIGDPSIPNGTLDLDEVEGIEVDSISILDEDVHFGTLHPKIQGAILEIGQDLEFEVDEPDYEEPDYEDD